MRVLLTNDDGIDAPGLEALAEAAALLGPLVTIAPTTHLSGCGHRVTTDSPIRLSPRGAQRWAIDGTPADCVRVALARLAPDVDWVLAGVNHGGNLGADIYHSGTVAAAREAALYGRQSIALSHYRKRGRDIDWPRARRWLARVFEELLRRAVEPGTFWNVNLPHLAPDEPEPALIVCPLEGGPLPLGYREEAECLHYSGNYHERRRRPGSDVDVCFAGNIAVTQLVVAV
jgi:5'-nucleotidase